MRPTLEHYLVVGALLFALGLLAVVTRRGAAGMLAGIALMLNGAALNFVAFDRYSAGVGGPGQVFGLFIVVLSAGEAGVAVALALHIHRLNKGAPVDEMTELRH